MKLGSKLSALVITAASTCLITGCAGPAGFSYKNVSISLTVECADCPSITYNPALPQPPNAGSAVLMPNSGQGGVSLYTAHVTNAPANVTWTLYPTPNLTVPGAATGTTPTPTEAGSQVGTVSAASGNTAYYTQNGVPIYTGAALLQAQAMGIPQGDVMLVASVPSDPNNPSAVVTASQLIQIYGGKSAQGPPVPYLSPATPNPPAGLTNPVVTISHLAPNNTYQFFGGAAGAAPCTSTATCGVDGSGNAIPIGTTDNSVIWEVGPASSTPTATAVTCSVASLCPFGTISQAGLYTAPATIPSPQPVIVVISHLVPTSSPAVAYIAVN